MIEPEHPRLSIVRQCELVSISRSSYYEQVSDETPLNLALMRVIDGGHAEFGTPARSKPAGRHAAKRHLITLETGTFSEGFLAPTPAGSLLAEQL